VIVASGYSFVCRYLSRSTLGEYLTKSEADERRAAGLDIVCVWETSAGEALDGYSAGRRTPRRTSPGGCLRDAGDEADVGLTQFLCG
jgi:Domain of unknown function (DUF1906)